MVLLMFRFGGGRTSAVMGAECQSNNFCVGDSGSVDDDSILSCWHADRVASAQKRRYKLGMCKNMVQWAHAVQELAAVHPQVWRKIILMRGLIAALWYNVVRNVLMGAGRALL